MPHRCLFISVIRFSLYPEKKINFLWYTVSGNYFLHTGNMNITYNLIRKKKKTISHDFKYNYLDPDLIVIQIDPLNEFSGTCDFSH